MYVNGKKHLLYTNVCRWQVVWFLHIKSGVATDGAQNLILMKNSIEEETPTKLKTWAFRTISGCLYSRVGVNQLNLGTSYPIRERVCWQGRKKVVYWVIYPLGGKCEPWLVAPECCLQVMRDRDWIIGNMGEENDGVDRLTLSCSFFNHRIGIYMKRLKYFWLG